jgi:hypothetical protein
MNERSDWLLPRFGLDLIESVVGLVESVTRIRERLAHTLDAARLALLFLPLRELVALLGEERRTLRGKLLLDQGAVAFDAGEENVDACHMPESCRTPKPSACAGLATPGYVPGYV